MSYVATMPKHLTLGWATSSDYDELGDVVFDAVRNGPSKYTEAQRQQWVPERRSGDDWNERLAGQAIAIASDAGRIVGLMSLTAGGYIDFAFIRPDAQGTGLFRKLFGQIEELSHARDETRLWVHASLMAEPAFAAVGFAVIERQVVQIGTENFDRAMMEKYKLG